MGASMTDLALVATLAAKAIHRAKTADQRAMTRGPNGMDGRDGVDGKDGQDGRDGRDGVDGKDGQDGAPGVDGKDGRNGVDGKDGADGKDGQDGRDGAPGVDGKDGHTGAKGAPGKQGEKGDKGDTPAHEWIGTGLRFERPDGTWGETVDLRGQKGSRGDKGASGGGGGGAAAAGFDPSGLALASAAVPDEFVVKQGAAWVRATYAQMQAWLGSDAIDGGAAASVYLPAQVIDGGNAIG